MQALIASLADTKGYIPKTFDGAVNLLKTYATGGKLPLNFLANERGEDDDFLIIDPEQPAGKTESAQGILSQLEADKSEQESIEQSDEQTLRSANLDSFKNILSVKALRKMVGYVAGRSNAELDSQIFLTNRDNYLLQDTFNLLEIDIMRSFREITLDPCEHVYKIYLPPDVFKELLVTRRRKPVRLRYPAEEEQFYNLSSVVNDALFVDNPLHLKIRMMYDGKLSKFAKMFHKLNALHQKKRVSQCGNELFKKIYDVGEKFGLSGIQLRMADRSRALVTKQKKILGHMVNTATGILSQIHQMATIPPKMAKDFLFSGRDGEKLDKTGSTAHTAQGNSTPESSQGSNNQSLEMAQEADAVEAYQQSKQQRREVAEEDTELEEGLPQRPGLREFVMRETMVDEALEPLLANWTTAEERGGFETVMVHLHGGGFMSMSSSSHQVYLRKWAYVHRIPIFSVEYRLAPQTPYPFLLNDCIRGYLWVLLFLEKVMKCPVKKVILAGDSAGGNLALALTSWCLEHGVRRPDLLHLYYPALSLDRFDFSPSYLYSVQDYFLNYGVLKGSIEVYVPAFVDPETDHYVSPLKTPDLVLANFPPLELFVCERDPLRDDALRFALRML